MNTRDVLLTVVMLAALPALLSGCAPAVVGGAAVAGGAAYGGYKGATDERSVGTMVDDSVIAGKVKTKLIATEEVKARHIDVDVVEGTVYLVGAVESAAQKHIAADIAAGVNGVRNVENQLAIGSHSAGQVLDDTIVSSRIRTELIKDGDIRSTNIDVDTIGSTITLTGIVRTEFEKGKVLVIVDRYKGYRDIVDNIRVSN